MAQLGKLATEKKEIILMGDCNINILNCNSENGTSDFIDTVYASSFYPTITLIDNIFLKKFTKNILVGNIAVISDHLTQFLITTNQNKSFPEKEKMTDEHTGTNLKIKF